MLDLTHRTAWIPGFCRSFGIRYLTKVRTLYTYRSLRRLVYYNDRPTRHTPWSEFCSPSRAVSRRLDFSCYRGSYWCFRHGAGVPSWTEHSTHVFLFFLLFRLLEEGWAGKGRVEGRDLWSMVLHSGWLRARGGGGHCIFAHTGYYLMLTDFHASLTAMSLVSRYVHNLE
jgi:hypothetical protein